MITTGYFPQYVERSYDGQGFQLLRRHDASLIGYCWPGDNSHESNLIVDLYEGSFGVAPSTSGSFDKYQYGGFLISSTGAPTPAPPSQLIAGPKIRSNNQPLWGLAKKKSDIIVSDYENIVARISYQNGGVVEKGRETTNSVPISAVAAVNGVPITLVNGMGCYDFGLPFLINSRQGECVLRYTHEQRTDEKTPYQDGWDDSIITEYVHNMRHVLFDDIQSYMTPLTAKANTGTLDILTSLAEMPQTVKSVYDGLKFMLRGLKDLKRKQVSALSKSKRIKAEYIEKVYRLDYQSKKEYLAARNERSKRVIAARVKQKRKQLENNFKRSLDDLALGASSVWLNYRYNIETTSMMIADLCDAILEKEKLFFRWSFSNSFTSRGPDVSGFSQDGVFSFVRRGFIKRAFGRDTKSLFQHLSANVAVTAWELIPFSFVYDWIINIGDFIATAASSTLQKAYKEGSTISLKCDGSVVYTGANKSKVTVELQGYKRNKINPNDYCHLIINPDITGKRQIDALALSWQIFVKRIWKN